MQNRQNSLRRSPIINYGVLAVLVIALFAIGYRAGTTLTGDAQLNDIPDDSAVQTSGGAALVQPPPLIQDFTLLDKTGAPLSLSDLRGEPVLLFFGYTHCPDECPTTMADYTRVKQLLGTAGDQVHFVFVSVDGERDTPDLVAEFTNRFDQDFIGMTGSTEALQKLGAQFGLVFDQVTLGADGTTHPAAEQDENYFVTHISPSFLIDKDGYLKRVIFYSFHNAWYQDQVFPQSTNYLSGAGGVRYIPLSQTLRA